MERSVDTCPVCGHRRENTEAMACERCGFEHAYQDVFAGETSFAEWRRSIESRKKVYNVIRWKKLRDAGSQLVIGCYQLVFHNAVTSTAVLFKANSPPQYFYDIKKVGMSLNGLDVFLLKNDGTLNSLGMSYDYGKIDQLKNVVDFSVSASSICVIYADGSAEICNVYPHREKAKSWRNIVGVVSGVRHYVGLANDGTVVQIGKDDRVTLEWRNVRKLTAATNYTLAMHNDGTVSYDGPDVVKEKAVSEWRDIISIAADTQYALGATASGDVVLAGAGVSQAVDLNKKEAADWKNVEIIAAGQSTIGAVTTSGELLLAGNIFNREEFYRAFAVEAEKMLAI